MTVREQLAEVDAELERRRLECERLRKLLDKAERAFWAQMGRRDPLVRQLVRKGKIR